MGAHQLGATVGVADHCGWAILVTVSPEGKLLDRRRVELVDAELPAMPHHHEAQGLPDAEAIALVEGVRSSAEAHAEAALQALSASIASPIVGISLRACPKLPRTIPEILGNYQAQCVADSVMYRQALARAAQARGWALHAYEVKRVFSEAEKALGISHLEALLAQTGAALGPPWQKDHRVAMAAAMAAQA